MERDNFQEQPIDKFVSEVKKALNEYNNKTNANVSVKIVRDFKEFELIV